MKNKKNLILKLTCNSPKTDTFPSVLSIQNWKHKNCYFFSLARWYIRIIFAVTSFRFSPILKHSSIGPNLNI
jgi:hypothetical protein